MRSTFSRTFGMLVITLVLAFLTIGTSFQLLVKNYLVEKQLEDLRSDGEAIVTLLQSAYDGEGLSGKDLSISLTVASAVSGADAVICDSDGVLVMCAKAPLGCSHQGLVISRDYLERVFRTGYAANTTRIDHIYDDERYVVSLPIFSNATGQRLGIVMVSYPTERSAAVLTRISTIFMWVSLLVILVAVALMVVFARRQSRHLQQMARAANAFGHGDLTARVDASPKYAAEITELATSFNNMAASLQKSEYRRQEFVANVSHELKTPMTTISGYVDGILDGTIPPEKQEHYLQIVSDETKRLNRLVRSMLDISRLQDQGGIPEERKTRFDLEESLGQVLIAFEQKINHKKLQVEVSMPEHPVFTHADADYVTQVIYNLLDNAVKFCPEAGELAVSVREGSGKAYISIRNDGPTIPAEELPLVFDRFHKIDKSRSQNRDSWGLGLYIAKTIVCAHGENISVTSREGKTTFTFTMPLVR